MKLLYFHQHFSTPEGATGIRSYEMAQRLIDQGHEVTIVCGSYGGAKTGLDSPFVKGKRRGNVNGIDIIELDLSYSNADSFLKRTLTFLRFATKSVGLALTEQYDVVFATTTPLTAGIPGIFAKLFRRKPFVFEVRDLWPELPKAMGVIKNPLVLGAMSVLEWASYRSADRCIGLSPGIVQGIKKRGVKDANVTMISNGCDLSIFSNVKEKWRPDNISEEDFLAVFTGTHGIANGLGAVINAAEELQGRGRNDIKILLVGQGKLKASLQQDAQQKQLNNLIFHDPINKEKLSMLMKSADIGLQTLQNVPAFYYGTSPNKFFDYIASGLPVLNNYPGWLEDIINEYQCGFVVKPDDPVAFADALELAASDKARLAEMSNNSLKVAAENFNREKLANKWIEWVLGAKK